MSTEDRVRAYAKAFYEAALERWLGQLNAVARQVRQNPALLNRLQASGDQQLLKAMRQLERSAAR